MESATWCRTPLPPPPSEGCTADHKHPDYNPVAASERSEQRTERNHCGKRDERANGTATASMSAISISGGTDATNIAAPSFGAMPSVSLGTIVIVPPSDRTRRRGFVMLFGFL